MNNEGKAGWEEIGDPRLEGKFDIEELNEVASLAHKCVNRIPRRRPSMRDIVQVLSRIVKNRHTKKHPEDNSTPRAAGAVIINIDKLSKKSPIPEHQRIDSFDSVADSVDV